MNLTIGSLLGTVTDHNGHQTTVHVLLADGQPVATIATSQRGTGAREHAIAGIDVTTPDGWGTLRSEATPSTMAHTFKSEPTVIDALQSRLDSLENEAAYGFVKYAPEGSPLPQNNRPAYYTAVEAASKRFGREIVDGHLTGKPRSF